MSIEIPLNYLDSLREKKVTKFEKKIIKPPKGSGLRAIEEPQQSIPPLNSDIDFSRDIKPMNTLRAQAALSAVDTRVIPKNFNWKENFSSDDKSISRKKALVNTPGDQKLCGSCWAISAAGIVGDNFVISGLIDWKPNLSTTYSLACYPQFKCQGGNPAKLLNNIAQNGLVENHCIDYSWCKKNDNCNGKATKHFKAKELNLSTLVPNCGCYFSKEKHYVYKIDKNPVSVNIGVRGLTEDNIKVLTRKHIMKNGPVLGGYIVYKNFMKGTFSKVNGGVYLERGNYDSPELTFSDEQIKSDKYSGSHAVAIIGWGVAKNIYYDNNKKGDVPYWFCRNSWGTKWGDGGYFKMAMYPYNKISQFEKQVTIKPPSGRPVRAGGMVFITVSKKPELINLKQVNNKFLKQSKVEPEEFYKQNSKQYTPVENVDSDTNNKKHNYINFLLAITIAIFVVFIIFK